MGLRKLLKKARKAIGLPPITLKNAGKLAVAAAGGPVALGGAVIASKLKSAAVGGVKQVIRTKAAKSAAKKLDAMGPVGTTKGAATTMPGGAPIQKRIKRAKRVRLPRVKRREKPAKGSDDYYAQLGMGPERQRPTAGKGKAQRSGRKSVRRAPRSSTGAKRKPPAGGLNLKALSASWKAAGKPGTWQGWIASNK